MRFLLTALLLTTTLTAQTPKENLAFTLILSRHGIRPPLVAAADLNQRSSDPWPTWEVPLGYLTPHGELALQAMGAYLREDLAHHGLIPAKGCPNDIYLYSDTDERNIESTRSTFQPFAANCPALPIHITTTPPDPLFSTKALPALPADKVTAAHAANGPDFNIVAANPELNTLAHILTPHPTTHPAAKPILDDPNPLAAGSNLIEDLFLEYIDNKPLPEVGWGRVDAATLQRLLPLHAKAFNASFRNPYIASYFASNITSHILSTLQQAATAQPIDGAIGPTSTHLVYLSGHDTNLHALADLLNLNWTFDNISNDTPPDSQIVFELWHTPHSTTYNVRILIRQQATEQLRTATLLTLKHPPLETYITPPGCTSAKSCPLSTFLAAVQPHLNPDTTRPLAPLKLAPASTPNP